MRRFQRRTLSRAPCALITATADGAAGNVLEHEKPARRPGALSGNRVVRVLAM